MPISRFSIFVLAVLAPAIVGALSAEAPIVSFKANYPSVIRATTSEDAQTETAPLYPRRLIAPAIELDSPIERVGINDKGDMAVPDGDTENVGWYEDGTIPGESGTAVLAAHVFAAFSELDRLPEGSDMYVEMSDGSVRHFIVDEIVNYALEDLSPEQLFNRADTKRISLITCAGRYQRSLGTYDRRLVVSATIE